ncbi:hypothetical protein CDAR_577941 [Caerostris darwini]|uniref:Uncharacterized protein n=1 Tax=Caerostris darwini TaxID=1538125 RepID=A0AAV4SD48_9ARAC|nr:hypothetical protein CDAR_577941 [Caerostris darwini]
MRFCGACKPYKGSNNKEGALQPLFAPMAIVPEGKTKRGPKNLSPRPYRMDYISLTPSGSSGAAKRFGGWGRECNSTPPPRGYFGRRSLHVRMISGDSYGQYLSFYYCFFLPLQSS